jgi:hypothetical protein
VSEEKTKRIAPFAAPEYHSLWYKYTRKDIILSVTYLSDGTKEIIVNDTD